MDTGIYGPCDRAIKEMNRSSLKEFSRLKLADFDSLSVIRTIRRMYRKLAKQAEQEYFDVAYDAYILGLIMCGIDAKRTDRMAEKAITKTWVDDVLKQTDFVTLYRFDTETERKADRLIEAIAAVEKADDRGAPIRSMKFNRNDQIDNALKQWSKQVGQYAINMTDYAMLQAFEDAGIDEAEWVTEDDEKVCSFCNSMSGKRYKLSEYPSKPHINCRCYAKPVIGK